MRVTWLVPEVYGFIQDELQELVLHSFSVRVLSGAPVSQSTLDRLPMVSFFYCEPSLFFPWRKTQRELVLRLARWHGIRRMMTSGFDLRQIMSFLACLESLDWTEGDLIHSHFVHPSGLGGALKPEIPHLATLRGYDILTSLNYGALWNPFFRGNLTSRVHDKTIFNVATDFSLIRARQMLPAATKVVKIFEGVHQKSFQPMGHHTRRSLNISEKSVVFLAAGNLVPIKNYKFLISTFASWRSNSKHEAHLILCGDGELMEDLKRDSTNLGMDSCVHFMGRLSRSELTDCYNMSDVFVHPSLSEGFGNVIIESLLLGLPVIASPVGIAPEVIENGVLGFLCRLSDEKEWIEAFSQTCVEIDYLKRNVTQLTSELSERFSLAQRVRGYLNLYEELISIGKEE